MKLFEIIERFLLVKIIGGIVDIFRTRRYCLALLAIPFATFADELPECEVSSFYHSRKVERGMVENRHGVAGYELEAKWYGFSVGFEACYDLVGSRAFRYNELTPRVGYEHSFSEWLEASAEYLYKHEHGEDTHELEFGVRMPFEMATPFSTVNLDIDDDRGALYGTIGVERDFRLCDAFSAKPFIGMGYANGRRSEADFGVRRDGGRDIHAGAEFDVDLTHGFHLKPCVCLYDQLTSEGRHPYRRGFFAVAGAAVSVEF